MDTTVAPRSDRATGPSVKHVERTLASLLAGAPLSEQAIAATIKAHRSRRLTGPRPARRQILDLYRTAAGSAA